MTKGRSSPPHRYSATPPIDTKTEHLVSYIRVDLDDIVVINCEPHVDHEQAELPH